MRPERFTRTSPKSTCGSACIERLATTAFTATELFPADPERTVIVPPYVPGAAGSFACTCTSIPLKGGIVKPRFGAAVKPPPGASTVSIVTGQAVGLVSRNGNECDE